MKTGKSRKSKPWEQGSREPGDAALKLLTIAKKHPQVLVETEEIFAQRKLFAHPCPQQPDQSVELAQVTFVRVVIIIFPPSLSKWPTYSPRPLLRLALARVRRFGPLTHPPTHSLLAVQQIPRHGRLHLTTARHRRRHAFAPDKRIRVLRVHLRLDVHKRPAVQ